MKIVNAGYNFRHPIGFCIDRPSGSGDYLLLIIRSEAFAVLDGKKIKVTANSALIYKKGTRQLYGSETCEFVNDWFHFELEEGEDKIFSELGVHLDSVIALGETALFSSYIKNIFMERNSKNLHREATVKRYFELILLKLSEKINRPDLDNEHPLHQSFCALRNEIQLEPQRRWSIDEICKKLKMSRSYVQHLYKQFFGASITSDIRDSRIEYAKYLLSSTGIKISVISGLCGYDNDVHFMRIFKKTVGMTPSEFRNKS